MIKNTILILNDVINLAYQIRTQNQGGNEYEIRENQHNQGKFS